jgi:TRAP-type C4-dicarboxylate transport system permease small subunit
MFFKVLDASTKGLLVVASLLGFLLSFVVVADVIGRVVFDSPLKGTPEMVSSSIVIICYLMCAHAIRTGGMIEVDAFSQHYPPKLKVAMTLLSCGLAILLFGIILWGSWEGLLHAIESGEYEGEGALRVPMWPVRLSVVIGSLLAMFSYIELAVRQIQAVRRGEVLTTGVSH